MPSSNLPGDDTQRRHSSIHSSCKDKLSSLALKWSQHASTQALSHLHTSLCTTKPQRCINCIMTAMRAMRKLEPGSYRVVGRFILE